MKRFTRFCTLLMVLVTVFSLAVTANAESSVTYDGKANKFIFEPVPVTLPPTCLMISRM